MRQTVFRKKSLERAAAPEQLDDYLKAAGPAPWPALFALLLALASACVWCFFGSVPDTVEGVGVRAGTGAVCFIPASRGYAVRPGMAVRLTPDGADGALPGRVAAVFGPRAAAEAAQSAGCAWLAEIMPGQWVCPVSVVLDEAPPAGAACGARIILAQRRPVELLAGG